MSYSRQPQVVLTNGGALKQTPEPTITQPSGIVPVELEAEIATTTSLGVVKVGEGLSITLDGLLYATGSGGSPFLNVHLTSVNYTAMLTDCYIGATKKNIDITLPLGVVGKLYIVKNQADGSIKVQGSLGQLLDNSSSKTLGSDAVLLVVFDGTRWNLI
jgi:hypothetical protein